MPQIVYDKRMFRIVYCRLLVYNGNYNTDDGGTVKCMIIFLGEN